MSAYKDVELVLLTLNGPSRLTVHTSVQNRKRTRQRGHGIGAFKFEVLSKNFTLFRPPISLSLYLDIDDHTNAMINLDSLVGTD